MDSKKYLMIGRQQCQMKETVKSHMERIYGSNAKSLQSYREFDSQKLLCLYFVAILIAYLKTVGILNAHIETTLQK